MAFDKATAAAAALVVFWIAMIVTGFATPNGWITDARGIPVQGDYAGVYTAGELALKGDAKAAYDWDRQKAEERRLFQSDNSRFYPWPYPPMFLFVAAALATLPYFWSMLAWSLVSLAGFAHALAKITRSRRDLLMMLAAPAAWLNFYVGQNGALSAALVGFGLYFVPSRPLIAGIFFGLLSYKPHLGLLVPIALLAGGYYRVFASSAVTVVCLAASSVLFFGTEPWAAMPEQIHRVSDVLAQTKMPEKIQSAFGVARGAGLSPDHALIAQGAVVLCLMVATGWLWRRRDVAFDLKAAALATAMTLASPYQFVYDLMILTIAQAFLLRHVYPAPLGKIEIFGLVLSNCLIFCFAALPIPLGIFASLIVGALIIARLMPERAALVPSFLARRIAA